MSRFKRIFLHIGPHKTGTSAIQRMADENRAVLARYGILYPTGRWHGQLGSCFACNKLAYVYNRHAGATDLEAVNRSDAAYKARLLKELDESDCQDAVFSYEGFIDLRPGEVKELINFLRGYCNDIRIVAYCRHPLSFAPSQISQQARMGLRLGRDGDDYPPIPRFESYFAKFATILGAERFIVSDFSKSALYANDVRLDFLKKIGFPDGREGEIRLSADVTNESLSAEAVAIAVEMAKSSPNLTQDMFFRQYNSLLSSIKGAPIRLPDEEKISIMAESRPHLEYLRRTFGLELREPNNDSNRKVELFGHDTLECLASQLQLLIDHDTQIATVTRNDLVVQAYRWLLGREPESDEVIAAQLRDSAGDWTALRTNIMRSPEFFRKVVLISRDGLSEANRVLIITALFASLYERDALGGKDFIRLYLAYCYKNRAYLQKGELGLAIEVMIRQPELVDIVFNEMTQYREWTTVALFLRTLSRAIQCFRDRQYDTFEMLLCDVDWPSIDIHCPALVNQTSIIDYMRTLRPPLVTRKALPYGHIQDEIYKFYTNISASWFVDSLLECVIEENRLAAFTSCDLAYYSAFADTLGSDIGSRRSVFLVIILCCGAREEGTAREMAARFNEKFTQTALTIVQVHQMAPTERSFYTVPRLLALAYWLCVIGREGISFDIDVLCGPKFDQPAGGPGAEKWDVMLPIKPEGWPWSKVFATYIRVKPTSGGREFARAFLTYLLEMIDLSRSQWHIDQNALLVAYLSGLREENLQVYDIWPVFGEVIFMPSSGGLEQKIKDIANEINLRSG
jgi:hypothetical protein